MKFYLLKAIFVKEESKGKKGKFLGFLDFKVFCTNLMGFFFFSFWRRSAVNLNIWQPFLCPANCCVKLLTVSTFTLKYTCSNFSGRHAAVLSCCIRHSPLFYSWQQSRQEIIRVGCLFAWHPAVMESPIRNISVSLQLFFFMSPPSPGGHMLFLSCPSVRMSVTNFVSANSPTP